MSTSDRRFVAQMRLAGAVEFVGALAMVTSLLWLLAFLMGGTS